MLDYNLKIMRLREELSNQQKEAKNEREGLLERLSAFERNLMQRQAEELRRTQREADLKVVNSRISDTEAQM